MTTVQSKQDVALMAHLLRRASFGATKREVEERLEMGYEATVDDLLSRSRQFSMPEDIIRRYHVDQSDLAQRCKRRVHTGYTAWRPPRTRLKRRWLSCGTGFSRLLRRS